MLSKSGEGAAPVGVEAEGKGDQASPVKPARPASRAQARILRALHLHADDSAADRETVPMPTVTD